MPLVLHKVDGSPPVRAVFMTLDILGLDAKMVEVNTLAGDTRKPEFIAKNPMHTIPLLEDGDFILADSHAIITYLVSKYGTDRQLELYSNDVNLRAIIDQRMYFDDGVLFPRIRTIIGSILKYGAKETTPQQIADLEEEGYGILEKYLEKQPFVAHSKLTLADISIVSSVSSLDIFVPISDKFPKLTDWFNRMKNTEFYKRANEPGLNQLREYAKTAMEKNAS